MYSIVLMMALGSSAEAPARTPLHTPQDALLQKHSQDQYRHRRWGCHGCWGRYGCWGSCMGCWGCYGCWSSCMGCMGCFGCWGCYGGMAYTSYGGPIYGSMVASSPQSSGVSAGSVAADQGRGAEGGVTAAERAPAAALPELGDTSGPAPAVIRVSLPLDARLTVDDHVTQASGAVRTFVTPPLQPGREYYYTLTGELARDGQLLRTSREIAVRAGKETDVLLEFPVAGVARK